MKRSQLLCSICAVAAAAPLALAGSGRIARADGPEWGYSGAQGPQAWGSLEPDFKTCAIGTQQSPIDLSSPVMAQVGSLTTDYKPSPMKIINNGHTIQVNYAPGSTLTIRDHSYEVQQFHFHTPSEHKVNGKDFPLEMHVVHKDQDGNLAVLGVLFEEGPENKALNDVWNNAPATPGPEKTIPANINVAALVPSEKVYYEYLGSLTTPPCTESVKWVVLGVRNTLSAAQIAKFRTIFSANARPVQPVNQRFVLENA